MIIKNEIKKILINKYLIKIKVLYNKYDSYRGCQYSIYNIKNKTLFYKGGCNHSLYPEDIINIITINLMKNKNVV